MDAETVRLDQLKHFLSVRVEMLTKQLTKAEKYDIIIQVDIKVIEGYLDNLWYETSDDEKLKIEFLKRKALKNEIS